MGNRGFIEPPPGLFGDDDDDQGSGQPHPTDDFAREAGGRLSAPPPFDARSNDPGQDALRFTIRTERGTGPIPPMPRLAPPPPATEQFASQPATEQFAPQPATEQFAPPPAEREVPVPAASWVNRPVPDRPGQPLPAIPRLTSPPPPPQLSAPEEAAASGIAASVASDTTAPRPGATGDVSSSLPAWSLVLSDGVAVPLYGPVVVGRNPSGERFPGATLAAVPDPTRTMSKTHARFYLDDGVPMVDDLGSTNGIALFPGGNTQGAMAVEPGSPAEVRSGDIVQLGEYEISVRRN